MDTNKLNDFIGKVVTDVGAAMSAVLVVIGDRLGLWKSLAEAHSAYGSLEALLDESAETAPRTLLPSPAGRVSAGPDGRNGRAR